MCSSPCFTAVPEVVLTGAFLSRRGPNSCEKVRTPLGLSGLPSQSETTKISRRQT